MRPCSGSLALSRSLFVTPIRDGMNVVPFQYVLCRQSHGELATVVLSEFAGCAQSLGGAGERAHIRVRGRTAGRPGSRTAERGGRTVVSSSG
jgi:hypothetical protein